MHTLGKVLMAFVIIGALAGTYLAARLLDTRAKWMAQIEQKAVQYEENLARVADARRRAIERENEVNRLLFANSRYWTAPNSVPAQGTTISLGIGSNQELARTAVVNQQTPYAHLFYVDDAGVSKYLGHFMLDPIQPDETGAILNREPYPGETQGWQAGTYRVRMAIPAPYGEEFTALWSQYGTVTQSLESELGMLRRQQEALVSTNTQYDERMQELQGHNDAPEDADVVERVGLVEAMQMAEFARDVTLEQLDVLRQEYSAKWYQLQAILDGNQQRRQLLEQSLENVSRPITTTPVSQTP